MENIKLRQNILAHFRAAPDFPLHCLDTVDSTNTYAKELARQGAPHGTVVVAHRQTGGRGRLGRSFHSPGGLGVYFSVILRPNCPPDKLMHLTCAVGEAMCDAVEAVSGIRPGIKWTNDLVLGKKKLGGILTELSVDSQTGLTAYAVVGIGINCRQTARDFPADIAKIATSLAMEAKRDIDPAGLIAAMIRSLREMDSRLLTERQAILDAYRADCVTLGQSVRIVRGDAVSYGTALDIDGEGGLLIRRTDGSLQTVSSGEVSIRGMYGYL